MATSQNNQTQEGGQEKCANCLETFEKGARRYCFKNKFHSPQTCTNHGTVYEALQNIFFSDHTPPDCPPLSATNERLRSLCKTCANFLRTTYKYLLLFKERTKEGSYLDIKLRTRKSSVVQLNPSRTAVPVVLSKGTNAQGFVSYSVGVSQQSLLALASNSGLSGPTQSGDDPVQTHSRLNIPNQVQAVLSTLPTSVTPVGISTPTAENNKQETVKEIMERINKNRKSQEVFFNYVGRTISKEIMRLAKETTVLRSPAVLEKEQDLYPDDELLVNVVKNAAPLLHAVLRGALITRNVRGAEFPLEFRSVVAILVRFRHQLSSCFQKYISLTMYANRHNFGKMVDSLSHFGICSSHGTLQRLLKTIESTFGDENNTSDEQLDQKEDEKSDTEEGEKRDLGDDEVEENQSEDDEIVVKEEEFSEDDESPESQSAPADNNQFEMMVSEKMEVTGAPFNLQDQDQEINTETEPISSQYNPPPDKKRKKPD